jgi:hypothetical protein
LLDLPDVVEAEDEGIEADVVEAEDEWVADDEDAVCVCAIRSIGVKTNELALGEAELSDE